MTIINKQQKEIDDLNELNYASLDDLLGGSDDYYESSIDSNGEAPGFSDPDIQEIIQRPTTLHIQDF